MAQTCTCGETSLIRSQFGSKSRMTSERSSSRLQVALSSVAPVLLGPMSAQAYRLRSHVIL